MTGGKKRDEQDVSPFFICFTRKLFDMDHGQQTMEEYGMCFTAVGHGMEGKGMDISGQIWPLFLSFLFFHSFFFFYLVVFSWVLLLAS